MLALLKTAKGKGHIELLDMPVPKLRGDEVLIRVRYAGICGTDLKIYADQAPYRAPVVLGHEFSGEIVQLGSDVLHWSVGDPVVSQTAQVICGHCSYCRTGRELMCAARQSIGYGVDGAFAEYIKVKARLLHRIPDGLSLETAVLAEPLAVAVHALMDHTRTMLGQRIIVFGPGPIGVLTALLADRAGGRVSLFGIRSDADRLDYIRNTVGLSGAVCPDPQQLKNQNPADIAVDCSGSQTAVRQIAGLLKPNGQWIQVGLIGSETALPYDQIVRKELCVQGSFGHRWQNWETGLKLLSEHRCVFSKVITHRHTPGQWFRLFLAGKRMKRHPVLRARTHSHRRRTPAPQRRLAAAAIPLKSGLSGRNKAGYWRQPDGAFDYKRSGRRCWSVHTTAMLTDLLPQIAVRDGMHYVRLVRKSCTRIYERGSQFTVGKGNVLFDGFRRGGLDVTVIASGYCVAEALKTVPFLQEKRHSGSDH